jgi:subtilisin family serine protease
VNTLPPTFDSDDELPEVVLGYVSVRSQGGTPFFDARDLDDVEAFYGDDQDIADAKSAIRELDLEIVAESKLGLGVAGSPRAYERLTGGKLVPVERLVHTRVGRLEYVTHLDIQGSDQPDDLGVGRAQFDAIEGVVLDRPRAPSGIRPTPIAPNVARFHLRVPDDVATLLGASRAHRDGHRGGGVTVAMVDSGWYRHPYFVARGYRVQPPVTVVPGTNPAKDPVGHGTGESANVFAVAPDAELRPVRISNDAGKLVGALPGFVRAKQWAPDVLTNSWGGDYLDPVPDQPNAADMALALEIVDAIKRGTVVVFSAGNGTFSPEAQVPGVIAAGGAYATAGLELQASDYSSGFRSAWFGGVDVPTVSGLVGMRPRASYIMMPVPERCEIDVARASAGTGEGAGDPPDGTTANDGWALFSGTSAAAPQIAGAAAVLLGKNGNLTPAQVTQALSDTAVDVLAGRCHPRFNHQAGPGYDLATGWGLINVSAAAAAI